MPHTRTIVTPPQESMGSIGLSVRCWSHSKNPTTHKRPTVRFGGTILTCKVYILVQSLTKGKSRRHIRPCQKEHPIQQETCNICSTLNQLLNSRLERTSRQSKPVHCTALGCPRCRVSPQMHSTLSSHLHAMQAAETVHASCCVCGRIVYLAACFDRHAQPVSTDDDKSFLRHILRRQVARPLIHALPQTLHVVSPLPPDQAQTFTGSIQHSAILNRQTNFSWMQLPNAALQERSVLTATVLLLLYCGWKVYLGPRKVTKALTAITDCTSAWHSLSSVC